MSKKEMGVSVITRQFRLAAQQLIATPSLKVEVQQSGVLNKLLGTASKERPTHTWEEEARAMTSKAIYAKNAKIAEEVREKEAREKDEREKEAREKNEREKEAREKDEREKEAREKDEREKSLLIIKIDQLTKEVALAKTKEEASKAEADAAKAEAEASKAEADAAKAEAEASKRGITEVAVIAILAAAVTASTLASVTPPVLEALPEALPKLQQGLVESPKAAWVRVRMGTESATEWREMVKAATVTLGSAATTVGSKGLKLLYDLGNSAATTVESGAKAAWSGAKAAWSGAATILSLGLGLAKVLGTMATHPLKTAAAFATGKVAIEWASLKITNTIEKLKTEALNWYNNPAEADATKQNASDDNLLGNIETTEDQAHE